VSAAVELEKSGRQSIFMVLPKITFRLSHESCPSCPPSTSFLKQVRRSTRVRGVGGLFSRGKIERPRNSERRKYGLSRDSQDCPGNIGSTGMFKDFWAVTLRCVTGRADAWQLPGERKTVARRSHRRFVFLLAWLTIEPIA
jgi:hypothetical protein